jgi:hypothetical protein
MTPEQSQYLSSALSGSGSYSDFLQPYNPEQFSELFQKSFVNPSLQALQRQIIPGIKESFLGLDEMGSTDLNRALAQAATDVSTGLGQQYLNFYNQQQQNRLGALGQLGNLAGTRTFQPHIQQTQGILGPALQGLGSAVGGSLAGGGSAGIGPLMGFISSLFGSGEGENPTPSTADRISQNKQFLASQGYGG